MTTPPNIIDIVKEMQKQHSEVKAGENIQGSEEGCDTLYEIWHRFPAIAQAILIAVEALEHISKAGAPIFPEANFTCRVQATAQNALSRIRSLS